MPDVLAGYGVIYVITNSASRPSPALGINPSSLESATESCPTSSFKIMGEHPPSVGVLGMHQAYLVVRCRFAECRMAILVVTGQSSRVEDKLDVHTSHVRPSRVQRAVGEYLKGPKKRGRFRAMKKMQLPSRRRWDGRMPRLRGLRRRGRHCIPNWGRHEDA